MTRKPTPPAGKDLNYYIGWFKQEIGRNDHAEALRRAQHFMKTGRRPRKRGD